MRALAVLAVLSSLTLGGCAATTGGRAGALTSGDARVLAAAIADPARPAKQREQDEARKPAETLAFLGLRPGMDAADIITGEGYWAAIMARVVAPGGSLVAFAPTQFYTGNGKTALDALIAASPAARVQAVPFERFGAQPGSFDFAMMNLNYHDLYWTSEQYGIGRTDPDAYLRALYTAMRPGGVVGVIDHVGPAGDTRAIVEMLHRIDPATVRADFERAGFRLEASSDILANRADDHTANVFDAAIRGRTDRFLYKFRKPRR